MIFNGLLIFILVLVVVVIAVFVGTYYSRFRTVGSIKKLTGYEDGYDLYTMDVQYSYDLNHLIKDRITDDQAVSDAILQEALPLLPVHMAAPKYGCSTFSTTSPDGHILMGRNYDFERNTSAMIVYAHPKNGYRSVGTAALDHLDANRLDRLAKKMSALAAPFICLDGVNEKGVSISVLWVDSEPTRQTTEKQDIFTTLAIRLVLDRAATTQEAVDLLRRYDMFAVSGGDYQFYVADASGDGRVLEYDPLSETRELVDIPIRTATNFYQLHIDKVLPDQHNGVYGHGRERYDVIEEMLNAHAGAHTKDLVWETLEAAQQLPSSGDITSNTQWSVVYDNTALTAEHTIRRHWGDTNTFSLRP